MTEPVSQTTPERTPVGRVFLDVCRRHLEAAVHDNRPLQRKLADLAMLLEDVYPREIGEEKNRHARS